MRLRGSEWLEVIAAARSPQPASSSRALARVAGEFPAPDLLLQASKQKRMMQIHSIPLLHTLNPLAELEDCGAGAGVYGIATVASLISINSMSKNPKVSAR